MKTKQKVHVYLLLYGFCFFTFSVAIDGDFLGLWDHMYVHDSMNISILNLYYWFVVFLSYAVFYFLLSNKAGNFKIIDGSLVNIEKIRLIARLVAIVSLFATVRNTLGAGNPFLIFTDARAWEFAFGRNVVFNYLYFLHLLALVLFGILIGKGKGKIFDKLLVVLLILSSFFHGIKFTILHA
ncbi:MAG: hypothetical protein IE890_14080, partial [Arcobacter sp.]|nr:hypothetical protein [Arcobacter sp.]